MLSDLAGRIADLLIRSAETALRFLDDPRPEIKADQTVVTRADRAVEAFLTGELERGSAGIRVIGEETCGSRTEDYLKAALAGPGTFIIDPIDGTSMYARRIPFWGIMIGYAEHGVLLDGGTILPETGEIMLSDGGKTWYARSALPLNRWKPEAMLRELSRPPSDFDKGSVLAFSQRCVRGGVRLRAPNPVVVTGSTSYLGILLATGRVFGACHDAKLWDYAGILPALRNLGFVTVPVRGNGDLMNGSIGPDNYRETDFAADGAFRACSGILLASSREAAEQIRAVTDLPAEF